MNDTALRLARAPAPILHAPRDTLESRFALRVAARLTQRSEELAPDLSERLRFAREKALARAREARGAEATQVLETSRGGAALLGGGSGWWPKLAALVPAVVLACGLFMIQRWQDDTQISAAAEVDTALLADDLPPDAYSDAGFAEFLKTPGQ